jgi:hypothetical protein
MVPYFQVFSTSHNNLLFRYAYDKFPVAIHYYSKYLASNCFLIRQLCTSGSVFYNPEEFLEA